MPGTQPQGIHLFDPDSSSCVSATQALNSINAENNGEEDQAGPPLDTLLKFHLVALQLGSEWTLSKGT